MSGKMEFWTVKYSYLVQRSDCRPYRDNGYVGVVAEDIEAAITLARSQSPGTEVKVWSASHHGTVDAVQVIESPIKETAA